MKSERLEDWITRRYGPAAEGMAIRDHPCLIGYLDCFNRQQYYEAHDVLEHLWLRTPRDDPDYGFFKGLIQLAGGFVHLRLHFFHQVHRIHGRRLRPAWKLFNLTALNLAGHRPVRHALDIDQIIALTGQIADHLEGSAFEDNPWSPQAAPRLSQVEGAETPMKRLP